jgi:hypothetical protein
MNLIKAVPLMYFERIDIKADNADILILGGKNNAFELLNPHSIPLFYQVENKKLTLIQKEAGPRAAIELHIPDYANLLELRVRSERGDVSFERINLAQGNIHLYEGSLFIKHACLLECTLQIEQGELCAKKARFASCCLKQEMSEEIEAK